MKKSLYWLFGIALILIAVLNWKVSKSVSVDRNPSNLSGNSQIGTGGGSTSNNLAKNKKTSISSELEDAKKEAEIATAAISPLSIRGQVVDESGNPIDNAIVYATIANLSATINGNNAPLTTHTGFGGSFAINTIGMGAIVLAAKAGYHRTPQSSASCAPGGGAVVLRLRKMADDHLIHVSQSLTIDRSGKLFRANILQHASFTPDDPVLEFSCKIDLPGEVPAKFLKYPWTFTINAPGGGVVQNNNGSVEAPQDGYQQEITISSSNLQRWSEGTNLEIFMRSQNQKYARIFLHVTAGRSQFVNIDAFYNPTGSRSLDF